MKIAIVVPPGGHMIQALSVLDAFQDADCFLAVQNFPVAKDMTVEGIERIYKIPILPGYAKSPALFLSILWSFIYLFFVFMRERPQIVFSTGSEIAIPAFWVGKYLFGAKIIYLESLTRIDQPSQTGKYVYRISDLFLVQHPSLLKFYGPKAKHEGSLI